MLFINSSQSLPFKQAAKNTAADTGDLNDEALSSIFGVRICSITHEEFAFMTKKAEADLASYLERNPDGPGRGASDFFPAYMAERFPQYADAMTANSLLGLFFYGTKGNVSVIHTHPDQSTADSYAAFFIRPEKQADAYQYLSENCYGYNKSMFVGAALAATDLWHEFSTLFRASKALSVHANMFNPTLPEIFCTPAWKADAIALRAFLNRSTGQDFNQRKLIANQFYGIMALVTVTNTYSGAYESQLLKRLDDTDMNEKQIKTARNNVVDAISAPRDDMQSRNRICWGQGWGETFIIANENSIAPIYYALKDSLAKNEITEPLEQEIAEDFITGAELLFPRYLKKNSPHLSERLAGKFNLLQKNQPESLPPTEESSTGSLLRYIRALLPGPGP